MVKACKAGGAWNKPGLDPKYLNDMRAAGQASAAASMLDKDATEKAILRKVQDHAKLSEKARKRFASDTRGALRRVKDGEAATPCSNWSRKGCDHCRTGRVGDPHHIFCEQRDTFNFMHEKELAQELRKDIGKYHLDFWKAAGTSSEGVAAGSSSCLACAASSSVGLTAEGDRAPLAHGSGAELADGDVAPASRVGTRPPCRLPSSRHVKPPSPPPRPPPARPPPPPLSSLRRRPPPWPPPTSKRASSWARGRRPRCTRLEDWLM